MPVDSDPSFDQTALPDETARLGASDSEPNRGTEDTLDRDLDAQAMRARVQSELFGRPFMPVRIGRYSLLERIGAGAMGEVFAAFDDTLDRKVAIKVIQDDRAHTTEARERMLREAKAMARLSHPNVVHVYEAGADEGRVYIAMEFIRGATLKRWMHDHEQPRPWREVVELFVRIGDGLAAAHAAGVVHRDFKPDNVLVDEEGVPRVADFGLAGLDRSHTEGTAEAEDDERATSLLDPRLTSTGSLLGTPMYMAPEVWDGRLADARSDQFSFCVALYEALHAEPPFAGATVSELCAAVTQGHRSPPPKLGEVPRWLAALVSRGLSLEPDDRSPSMADVVATLRRGAATRQRTATWAVFAAGALGVAALFAVGREPPLEAAAAGADRCVDGPARIGEVWNEARRTRVGDALRGVSRSFAADTATRVLVQLDAYATGWLDAYQRGCEATFEARTQSQARWDAQRECLDARRRGLDAVAGVLAEPSETTLDHAMRAASRLPPIEACDDTDYVEAAAQLPSDELVASQVRARRDDLARVRALGDAGHYPAAQVLAREVVDGTRALEHSPLLVEALDHAALAYESAGDYDAAQRAADEAYLLADEASSLERGQNLLVLSTVAHARGFYPLALREARKARRVLAATLGHDHPKLAEARSRIGTALTEDGHYEEARVELDAVLQTRLRAHGPDHLSVAQARFNLGDTEQALGELEGALESYREALRIETAALGEGHPELATTRTSIGAVLHALGRHEDALAQMRATVDIRKAALGEEHPAVGKSLGNVGNVLWAMGRYDESVVAHRAGIAVMEARVDEDHPQLAGMIHNLAVALSAKGDSAEARVAYRRALELKLARLGPNHPDVGSSRLSIGHTLLDEDRAEEGLVEFEAALEIYRTALGDEHPDLALAHNNVGLAKLALGREEEALAHYQKAVELQREGLGEDHPELAGTRINLASVLRKLGRAREAEAELLAARGACEKSLGPKHRRTSMVHANLGNLRLDRGDLPGAISAYEAALAARREAPGEEHREVAIILHGLGTARLAGGELEAACEAYARGLAIRERAEPPGSRGIAYGLALVVTCRAAASMSGAEALLDARAQAQRASTLARAHSDDDVLTAMVKLAMLVTDPTVTRPDATALRRLGAQLRAAGDEAQSTLVDAWLPAGARGQATSLGTTE